MFSAVELSLLTPQAVHWWSPFNTQKVIWMRTRKEMGIRNLSHSVFCKWIKASSSGIVLERERFMTLQAKWKMQWRQVCGWLHICLLQSSRQHGWEQNSCCSSSFNRRSWDWVHTSLQTATVLKQRHISCSLAEFLTSCSQREQVQHLVLAYCPAWPLQAHCEWTWAQPEFKAGLTWGLMMLGQFLDQFWGISGNCEE